MNMHPVALWMAASQSSLALLKQMNEMSLASFQAGMEQLPDNQTQGAQLMKSALKTHKEWTELQADAGIGALRAQADALNIRPALDGLQNALELSQKFSVELSSLRDNVLQTLGEHSAVCLERLRQVRDQSEVTIVLAGVMHELDSAMRERSKQTLSLLHSANTAAAILVHKTLDEMGKEPAVAKA